MGKKKRKKEKMALFMPQVEQIKKRRQGTGKDEIRANVTAWSEKSRRSLVCWERYKYENEKYRCRKCGADEIFTAEQQQHAYEVEKRYIWQRRVLCATCYETAGILKGLLKQRLERWEQEKDKLRRDVEFLEGWYKELDRFRHYGLKGYDSAKMQMIEKLLEQLK